MVTVWETVKRYLNADEAKGDIYYGLHFYPGLAEYREKGVKPYRVYLNEDTLRSMDPSFSGRPVFVLHVDEIETDLDQLRSEADGWVVESFYNEADGKHWAKFIVVSENAKNAIRNGMKLSNCYIPTSFAPGGQWNGIDYDKEVKAATYEHLAIVPNPRYEESVILTPEEFKQYNDEKKNELLKLANNNNEGVGQMKFNFFKRAKVENTQALDLESMSVVLPRSKKEVELVKLINAADEEEAKKDEPKMAHPEHQVEVGEKKMSVKDLKQAYMDACNAIAEKEEAKKEEDKENDDDESDESEENGTWVGNPKGGSSVTPPPSNDDDQDMEVAKKSVPKSEDDERGEKRALKLEREEEKEVKDAKKKNAKEKASALRNAGPVSVQAETAHVYLSADRVAKGKSLYGSK